MKKLITITMLAFGMIATGQTNLDTLDYLASKDLDSIDSYLESYSRDTVRGMYFFRSEDSTHLYTVEYMSDVAISSYVQYYQEDDYKEFSTDLSSRYGIPSVSDDPFCKYKDYVFNTDYIILSDCTEDEKHTIAITHLKDK